MATTSDGAQASDSGSAQRCNFCNSDQIVYDDKFGVVCANCSMVLEENVIVNSTSFSKGDNGASTVNGQFVGEYCTTPLSNWGVGGAQHGFLSSSSKDLTISRGKKKIQWMASQLGLDSHMVEAAHRLFVLAVQRNFLQGRKTLHVVATCLYIVCRRESAPRLLIDFSEVLQTNVFKLGSTFLKFKNLLNIRLPVVDPTHYIERFAAKLEFEEKEIEVTATARRIVNRMKKDWIQTGRSPAGICGAALIVAARMHGFSRSEDEVVEVMRICEQTLKNRLMDFENTASSNLTMEEFLKIDLPAEADPPALVKNIQERQQMKKLTNGETETNEKDSEETAENKNVDSANSINTSESKTEDNEEEAEVTAAKYYNKRKTPSKLQESRSKSRQKTYDIVEKELQDSLAKVLSVQAELKAAGKSITDAPVTSPSLDTQSNATTNADENNKKKNENNASLSTVQKSTSSRSASKDLIATEGDEFLDPDADGELDGLILSKGEAEKKAALWNSLHRGYLEEKAEKERLQKAAGTYRKRGRKKKSLEHTFGPAADAAEATRNMVEMNKKVSKKINYDKWNELFGKGDFS